MTELLLDMLGWPMTVPVCAGGVGVGGGWVGLGVGCWVGCVVGVGCAPLVGEGLAVGDCEGVAVFCGPVPCVGADVGVLPGAVPVVPLEVVVVGAEVVSDWDCLRLCAKWAKLIPPIPITPATTPPVTINLTACLRSCKPGCWRTPFFAKRTGGRCANVPGIGC